MALSGILLVHKDVFLPTTASPGSAGPPPALSTTTVPPVLFERALTMARERFGDVVLEKAELKQDGSALIYAFKTSEEDGGRELLIDASTGKVIKKDKRHAASGQFDYRRLVKDLHSGKLGGKWGKLIVDAIAAAMIGLALSGFFLWRPPWRRSS